MIWVYYVLLLILSLCGMLLVVATLPGLWLMLAAAGGYALLSHGNYLGWKSLVALLILASVAEVIELYIGAAGAKSAGASRWGMLGAVVGALVGGILFTGLIPIPVLGTIAGVCMGSFLGAFGVEIALGQATFKSIHIGYGAAKGRLFGIFGKLAFGIVMLIITLFAALPIHL